GYRKIAELLSANGPEFVAKAVQDGSRLSVPRLPTSNGVALGKTATSRASTPAFAMSCLTARFSTLYTWPRSSSKGDATTTRSGPRLQSDTSHQHQRCSCLCSVAGCATPTGSAGHAGATANHKLTFHLDHSQRGLISPCCSRSARRSANVVLPRGSPRSV